MKILVLGADGFVGAKLVAALSASGWATPVAGTRRKRQARAGNGVLIDATDRASLAGAVRGIDAIVNCITGDAATIEANAAALFAVADGRRVVHLSSMAVYGSATGTLREDAPLLADTGAYATAKAAAERRAAAYSDVVIVRPGNIYGARSAQWSLRIAALLAHRRIGDLGARGDGCSNIVHVDDVVAAVSAILRDGATGIFNLAMPGAPDWNGYFLAFARALGTVPIRRIPAWQFELDRLAAVPLKLAEKMGVRAWPPISSTLTALWAQDLTIDPGRASTEIGIGWTPLADGLAEAAYWCASRLALNMRS